MEYIERKQWIEACQMFFDAYVKFQMDGTEPLNTRDTLMFCYGRIVQKVKKIFAVRILNAKNV